MQAVLPRDGQLRRRRAEEHHRRVRAGPALDEKAGVRFYPIETSSIPRIRVIGNRTEPDWHLRLEANTSFFIERWIDRYRSIRLKHPVPEYA